MDASDTDIETPTGTEGQAHAHDRGLNRLAVCHYVLGSLTVVSACSFLFYIVWGLTLLRRPISLPAGPPSPATDLLFTTMTGYLFAGVVTLAAVGGWTLGALTVYAGRCLRERKHYLFVLIVAGRHPRFSPGRQRDGSLRPSRHVFGASIR